MAPSLRATLRAISRVLASVAAASVVGAVAGDVLYAASVRNHLGDNPQALAGNLYRVDVAAGTFALVGSLRINREAPIGVTGLADVSETGKLYGITASSSPNYPRSLVMVDTATGDARLVGELGAAGSDIAFDSKGQLYAWLRETGRLGRVDLATGRAAAIGAASAATETGGLAINAKNQAYLAVTGAQGTLDTVDLQSGVVTKGPRLQDAPFGGINSLTWSPTGTLLAVNTDRGRPANAVLIRIDPSTGRITQLGPLPNDTDALVFVETPWNIRDFFATHVMLIAAMAALVGVALAYFAMRGKRGRDDA